MSNQCIQGIDGNPDKSKEIICSLARVVKCFCETLPDDCKREHKEIICCISKILENLCSMC